MLRIVNKYAITWHTKCTEYTENITRYESAMGRIEIPVPPVSDDSGQVTMGFNLGEA